MPLIIYSKLNMKKSISQVIGKRKSFDAKYFTRSPTMPALSYRANPHVSVDPMDDDKTDAIKDQRANLKDKRFRSAVSGCLYCYILEFLLMLTEGFCRMILALFFQKAISLPVSIMVEHTT